jgi:hypothetical protein
MNEEEPHEAHRIPPAEHPGISYDRQHHGASGHEELAELETSKEEEKQFHRAQPF